MTMSSHTEEIKRLLRLLPTGPQRIYDATAAAEPEQLTHQTETEPWSIYDILAHLRACSDSWGKTIRTMLSEDHPKLRYNSPRSAMKESRFADPSFEEALAAFQVERDELVSLLAALPPAEWARGATFSRTSPRRREQTVLHFVQRLVDHEQPHLDQIESLLSAA